MTPAIELVGLYKSFGVLEVARNIHWRLDAGARHALIGPNGAGKTTLVNLISGALAPTRGRIALYGEDVTGVPQAGRVKRGVARTFQVNQLFRGLSVLENVYLAVSERRGEATSPFRPVGARRAAVDEAMSVLDLLSLGDDASRPIKELPYGRQRLVEIAIALALKPRVLLLDEPAAGVPSAESHIILDAVAGLPRDMAVLIIEHDMDVVFRFAETITVMVGGAILAQGAPAEIAGDEEVRAVYLGEAAHG